MLDSPYLNLEESASYLHMSPGEFRQHLNDGKVPFAETTTGQVFDPADLQRFMDNIKQRKPIRPGMVQEEIELTRKQRSGTLTEPEKAELKRLREIFRCARSYRLESDAE